MRPLSIVRFERVFAAAILVSVLSSLAAVRSATLAATPGLPAGMAAMMPAIVWGSATVGIVVNLVLLHFIARRGSDVALWVYAGLLAIALASLARTLTGGAGIVIAPIVLVLGIVQVVLEAIGLWLLFRPDAKPWFQTKHRR